MKLYNYLLALLTQVLLTADFFFGIPASAQNDGALDDVTSSTETPKSSIWGGICEQGSMQSPIQLSRPFTLLAHYPPLKMINFDKKRFKHILKNNGYGVEMLVAPELKATISSGNLPFEYVLEKIQWHWDQSEHKMDDHNFTLETHLLFKNKRYFTWDIALGRVDGVVILAILHKSVDSASNYLRKIRRKIPQIVEPRSESPIVENIAIREILPKYTGSYYTYKGSLTSPPCSETVTWIVFTDYHEASNTDIAQFRLVKGEDGHPVIKNYRDIQPSYHRVVYHNIQLRQSSFSSQKVKPKLGIFIFLIFIFIYT